MTCRADPSGRAGYPVRINHQDGTTDFPRCGHGSGDRVQECWDDYKVIGASKVVNELRHIQEPSGKNAQNRASLI